MPAKLKMVISVECDIGDAVGVNCKCTAGIVAATILSAVREAPTSHRNTKVTSCDCTLTESFEVDL